MKKLIILILIPFSLYAQQYGWVKVAQLTNPVEAVDFVDSLHGWLADNTTGFYYTRDGGTNWQPGSGATVGPFSISMHDTLTGWAAGWSGSFGAIYKTTNGGISWVEQRYLRYRHYDGTATQSLAKNITIGHFISSGILDTGKLVRTTDGGTAWIEQTRIDSNNIVGFTKIFFLDSLHGWMSGWIYNIGTAVWRTNDGGVTWDVYVGIPGFQSISFVDTLHGWGLHGVGGGTEIYRTVDGGKAWLYQFCICTSLDELNPLAISFVDTLNGWAFGGVFYQGIITEGIYRTTNGGWTWNRESIGLTGDMDYPNDAKMLDLYHGWAVCQGGSVLRYGLITDVVEKLRDLPRAFSLHQNYPNPFNPETNIEFEIAHRSHAIITIYDAAGKEVKQLVNAIYEPGVYRVRFSGSNLATGLYYYTLKTESFSETKQMLLLK